MQDDNSKEVLDSERRQSDRKKLIVDVIFDGGDATGIANTRDISTGGLYMKTNREFQVGQTVAMRITLQGKAIGLDGIIVYIDEGIGVGVRFNNISTEKERLILWEIGQE